MNKRCFEQQLKLERCNDACHRIIILKPHKPAMLDVNYCVELLRCLCIILLVMYILGWLTNIFTQLYVT